MKYAKPIPAIMLAAVAAVIFTTPPTLALKPMPAATTAIFPGQADPRVSDGILKAFDHALKREYAQAKAIVIKLGKDLPDDPSGPTGEMVLYQVIMLENEDYELDKEFREAAKRAEAAADRFAAKAPKNDWYYTLLGACNGVKGIYFLRRDEYLNGLSPGAKGLNFMQTASKMAPTNWEARMGIGLYQYYRSAYASFIPGAWADQRAKGIAEVEAAGKNRSYLNEISWIALSYIYTNEKKYDQAVNYINTLIEDRPDYPVFYQLAGRVMMEKGDLMAAFAYYARMSQVDPNLYYPYYRMAEISKKLGKNDDAKKYIEQFFKVLGPRQSVHRKNAEKLQKEI